MKFTQSSLVVGELATGQALSVPVFHMPAKDSAAAKVFIQANVHGAEVQGNAVIFQLMKQLEQMDVQGEVTLLPLANPLGINQKSGEFTLGRFDPITGVNWNREYLEHNIDIASWYQQHHHLSDQALIDAYRIQLIESCHAHLNSEWGVTTGKRLAVTLQSMAHAADIVIDLHTGPKSCKHMYCPEYDVESASFFSIPFTLVIPNDFGGAMDEAAFCPWWQLSEYARSQGHDLAVAVSAFTLELGSQERIDMDDALNDAQGILAYLSHRGVVAEKVTAAEMPRSACYLKDYKKFHAPAAGMVEYKAELGHMLYSGKPLANVLRLDRYGTDEEFIELTLQQNCVPILHFASASVYQGTELYKVMTNLFKL
ncbi:succinylglutamate desuccinylase [Shewanella sairae]|uniref:Succinylglutamate desuccinylase n=1 Tax=Shewanella sairae TaxID=190310 RepID=A0ABQ4P774_9GAMM|nr:succinylglutamate desuccinylase/aspartoacylase family protein [Shewanella sairae]MCL1128849.1 M14 family metallopeptidase [Shewanella sairae]GIU43390.1 succinylglutamate desuccinylase [Shewanella sairae]